MIGFWKCKYVYQFILHSSDGLLKMKVCLSIYPPLKWWAVENDSTFIHVFSTQVMSYWKWKCVYQYILRSSDRLLKMQLCLSIYSPLKWWAFENESMSINLSSTKMIGCWKWKHVYQCILHSSDGLLKIKVCLSIYSPLKWWAIENESMSINLSSAKMMGCWEWTHVYQIILHSSDVLLKRKVISVFSYKIRIILSYQVMAIENECMSINVFPTQ